MSEYYCKHIMKEEEAMAKCFKILWCLLDKQAENILRAKRRAELNNLFREFFRGQLKMVNELYLFGLSEFDQCLEFLKPYYLNKLVEQKAVEKFTEMGYDVNTYAEVSRLLEVLPTHTDVLESLREETERDLRTF